VPNAAVLVRAGRIAFARSGATPPASGTRPERIDAGCGTIMPGSCEAHFIRRISTSPALEDLDIKYPVE